MVVIGNPPYKDKAKAEGGWIEACNKQANEPPPMDAFRADGNGKYEYVLSNLDAYLNRPGSVGDFPRARETACVKVLGHPNWEPRFSSNTSRVIDVADLREVLDGLILEWEPEELGRELLAVGVAASPVHDVAQALTSAQAVHREMVVSTGDFTGVGIPIKLSRSPGSVRSEPVHKGANTLAVLERAGFAAEDVARLIEARVAHEAEPGAHERRAVISCPLRS